MSDFQPFELKVWRKRHGLSQGDFAKLSGLAPMTIDKIETELHQVQERTLIKLIQAVRDYEASLKKMMPKPEIQTDPAEGVPDRDSETSLKNEVLSTDDKPNATQVVSTSASSGIEAAAPSVIPVKTASASLALSNLDLELITRIIAMTPIEKVNLLMSLIE